MPPTAVPCASPLNTETGKALPRAAFGCETFRPRARCSRNPTHVEIDIIRYRDKTSSPAITTTATATIIAFCRQASELGSFPSAMPRKTANPRPENNVRVTTELPPQSRSTRIASESAAQFPRAPAAHDGTSAANTDLRNRGAFFRHYEVQEEWDRASPYFRHYVACPPSSFAVAAYKEATRAGLAPPLVYDAPRHERAAEGALAELGRATLAEGICLVGAEASGSSVAGAAEEPLLSDAPSPKTSERMRAEDSEKTVWDPLELHR